jgi:O-methyltransferase
MNHSDQDRTLFERYERFTMIPFEWYSDNLQICREFAQPEGCIVECGVWRGGMVAGIADVLPGRRCYLFDSFEGLPPAKEVDGQAAIEWQSRTDEPTYFDNCRAERAFAEHAMHMSAAAEVQIVLGWFSDTVRDFVPAEPIAVLRLDGDWYESTMDCLTAFYPHVMHGGIVIVDDYYTWDGCARAVHDYLAQHEIVDRIQQKNGRVCFIQKLGPKRMPPRS